MAQSWHSLYLPTEDVSSVTTSLRGVLERAGYTRYDPFPGGIGTPPGLISFVKLFVAPAQGGWVRVLGEPDPEVLPELSQHRVVFHAYLDSNGSDIVVYAQGATVPDGLRTYLRPGKTPDDLARAEQGTIPTITDKSDSMLPDEIQQLAQDQRVNPQQANKLIDRVTGQLFARLDRASGGQASALQSQAQSLSTGAGRLDWNSTAARKLKGMMSVLAVPEIWRTPDFEALREAYQVARRLQKNPGAQLMPDEQMAIRAIPDAIQYESIYMGR